ncbi:MAG: PAS domain S-box protein [Pseudomonadota bacterium]
MRRNIHLEDEKSRRVEPDEQTSAEWDVAESAPAHVLSPDAGMSLAHTDIEQKGMGKKCALDEANALLAALFDRAPYGIVIAGIDGKFIRANTAFQVMTGLNEAELFNHSIESLTHQDDYLANKVLLDQLLSGERASFEIEKRYCLNDSTIWINSFVSTIDNSKCKNRYLVAIVRDITDRKRAEREVSSSQLELRSLYDRLQTIREEERISV